MTQDLFCSISNEVPRPVPPPTLRWFRNGVEVARASFGGNFAVEMDFLMQFPILMPMVFDVPVFQVLSSGQIVFTNAFTNITNAMIGNIPDASVAQARAMVFNLLLANWTCASNNSLGASAIAYNIRMCGELKVLQFFVTWL